MVLAHGLVALIPTSLERVVEALRRIDIASNVYYEVIEGEPRIAFFVGEKYFFRAGNYLSAVVIAIELSGRVVLRVIATGGRRGLLDFFDLGSSKTYAREIIERIGKITGIMPQIISEVDYLDAGKSEKLWKY